VVVCRYLASDHLRPKGCVDAQAFALVSQHLNTDQE